MSIRSTADSRSLPSTLGNFEVFFLQRGEDRLGHGGGRPQHQDGRLQAQAREGVQSEAGRVALWIEIFIFLKIRRPDRDPDGGAERGEGAGEGAERGGRAAEGGARATEGLPDGRYRTGMSK